MEIFMKKIISILLTIVLFVGCASFTFAEDDNTVTGTLSLVSFNVDGIPIPAAFSSTKRDPIKATKLIAQQINASGCDLLSVQEDFNLHAILEKNLDMDCATLTSGGVAVGDGLNLFSKYPIYNVGRVPWRTAYGVYDCGSDELTPKGILYCTVEISEGVFIDVYNIHADAWEDENSMLAKADQFDQLIELVEEHSGTDRAVILTGDFNTNYSVFREGYKNGQYKIDLCQKLLDNFIGHGFKDAWVEYNNGGNYDFTYGEMYARYGCDYPRVWDTLDHVYFRDGAGVSFELLEAVYDGFDCDEISWDGHLSDHAAVRTKLAYTVDLNEVKPLESKQTEVFNLSEYILTAIKTISSVLFKAIVNIPELIKNGIGWIK